jgi:hypothetical protein
MWVKEGRCMGRIITFLNNNKKINFDMSSRYYVFEIDKDIVADTDNLVKASKVLTKAFLGLSGGNLVGVSLPRRIFIDTNGNILIIINGYLNTFINTSKGYMLASSKIFGERFIEELKKLKQKKQQKQ